MTDQTTIPQWVKDLVRAQRDYERAKAKRDEAIDACQAFDDRFAEIERAKRQWQEEQMNLAWKDLEDGT